MKYDRLDFKMHLLKKTLNLVIPKILRFSSGVQPTTPQSRLILSIWDRLEDVLRKDVETGCFSDRNFLNLLEATKQALIFLCERDKYYKRWLGLLAMFVTEETIKTLQNFTYEDALELYARPLGLTKEEFEKHKLSLMELYLTGYLYGLSLLPPSEIPKIEKARVEHQNMRFPSRDTQALFMLFFEERGSLKNDDTNKEN